MTVDVHIDDSGSLQLKPVFLAMKLAKRQCLEHGYLVAQQGIEDKSLAKKQKSRIFRDFLKLCFDEIGADRNAFSRGNDVSPSSLSRWLSGLNVPPAYTHIPLVQSIYQFTRQSLE